MTGTPVETSLAFVPANSLVQKFLAFVDRFGDGTSLAPMHAPINTAGARIDPATTEDIQGLATALLSGLLQTAVRSNAPRVSNSKALTTAGQQAVLPVDGMGTVTIQVSGTWTGTLGFYGSVDGDNTLFVINATPLGAPGGPSSSTTTVNGQWELAAAPLTHVVVAAQSLTSGSANVLIAATNGGKIARVKAPASDPLPIISPLAAPITGQVKIATTGTAVALPTAALSNGILIKAKTSNAAQSGSYSSTVGGAGITTTYDGTGNGYPLAPGESASFACSNANLVYVNGTAGDVFSFQGN